MLATRCAHPATRASCWSPAPGSAVFCAGADLVQMAPDATGLEVHEGRGLLREVVLAMRACPVPVVASVQGLCLAGGVGLVLGCDVVLAADTRARSACPRSTSGCGRSWSARCSAGTSARSGRWS